METNRKNALVLNGTVLKWIAIITMAIDHFGAVIVENGILSMRDPEKAVQILSTPAGYLWHVIDMYLRTVGRLSFPIFCFLLAEGFLHTRSQKRYLLNLTVFAFISEIPFDIAVFGKVLEFSHQNVFFTLALGVLTLMGVEQYRGKGGMRALTMILGGVAAIILRTDYSVMGIAMILCFYLLRNNKKYQLMAAGSIAFVESLLQFGFAALAMIPIYFYNGERGTVRFKYFFYLFYPIHLLIFAGIRMMFFS